jgi:hypothetical protein
MVRSRYRRKIISVCVVKEHKHVLYSHRAALREVCTVRVKKLWTAGTAHTEHGQFWPTHSLSNCDFVLNLDKETRTYQLFYELAPPIEFDKHGGTRIVCHSFTKFDAF